MPVLFDNLTSANLEQYRSSRRDGDEQASVQINLNFYKGDHWQSGAGWVGPTLANDDPDLVVTMAAIKKAFVSQNVVKEVVGRHMAGVIGREPAWSLTVRRALADDEEPTAEEQGLINEAEAALTEWWDQKKPHTALKKLVELALLARFACLRLFVPPDLLNEDGQLIAATLDEALEQIFVHRPEVAEAMVYVDLRSMRELGMYAYKENGQTRYEVTYLGERDLAGERPTIVRILGGGEEQMEQATLPLGGRLTLYEIELEPLITEPVRQSQMQLNMTKTMMSRNSVQGGFLERIFLNAQRPGTYITDEDTGEETFVPAAYQTGPGTTNFIVGAETQDADGRRSLSSPSVTFRDPVSPDTFILTKQDAYQSVLQETHQLHALISGDATASGESRKQARADFEMSLAPTASSVNDAGRWLIETVLAMAAFFAGVPGRYAGLRAVFDCRVDAGPLTSEEQREIISQYEADLIDDETAMSRLGVDDVDAVKAKIAAAKEERAKLAPQLPQPSNNSDNPEAQGALASQGG